MNIVYISLQSVSITQMGKPCRFGNSVLKQAVFIDYIIIPGKSALAPENDDCLEYVPALSNEYHAVYRNRDPEILYFDNISTIGNHTFMNNTVSAAKQTHKRICPVTLSTNEIPADKSRIMQPSMFLALKTFNFRYFCVSKPCLFLILRTILSKAVFS